MTAEQWEKVGGPAFAAASDLGHQEGMSLRDWFAGHALAGLYADPMAGKEVTSMCREAYMAADAMLKARETSE